MNGIQYYKFMLDSNQAGVADNSLSVDQLQIYTTNNPAQSTTTFNSDGTLAFDSSTHLAYNLNTSGLTSNSVLATAIGSGIADMYLYIPVSDFVLTDKYVILYFLANSTYSATGAAEEWAAFTKTAPTVPDGSSTLALGSVGFGVLLLARCLALNRFKRPAEALA